MRTWGILFIVGGVFWTIAGLTSYASDIQLSIAVSGMNMIGIGAIMEHLGRNQDKENQDPS